MLHPNKIPNCSAELECLLDFQQSLLEYAYQHNEFKSGEFVSSFGQDVFDWINQNPTRQLLLDPLKSIISIKPEIKGTLLEKFKHDRKYNPYGIDNSFHFELIVTESSPEYLKNAKRLLVGYYVQLKSSGFHPKICTYGSDGFSGKHWWVGYRAANDKMNTCVVCDASLASGGSTLDHYFPKSQYPALSIHPANLIPLCKKCNNEIKKEKDPLAAHLITDIFLPYDKAVRLEIVLSFEEDDQGNYSTSIHPKGSDPETKTRVENFDDLFQVSEHWSDVLGDVSENAIGRVLAYIEALRANGKDVDLIDFPNHLDIICKIMERNWGKDNFEYLATEWLRWAKINKPDLYSKIK